jgi:uncharacterized protein (TIGR02271 family)
MDAQSKAENLDPQETEEPGRETEETVVPVIAEELVAGTKAVKTGAVRVHKRIQERTERIEMPLLHETVDVRRVVVNRVVDTPPGVRTEGDTIIVPVLEEEIIVSKRLVLKEEFHLTRRRVKNQTVKDVVIRREEAEVERVDAQGRSVGHAEPSTMRPRVVRRRNKIIPDS